MTTQTENFQLRLLSDNFDLSELTFLQRASNSYPIRGIFQEETLIACVEYDEVQEYESERILHIEMIEVVEKGVGVGTSVVAFLFEHLRLTEMSGEAVLLSDDSDRPLRFWGSLGASFSTDEEERESDFWENIPISFCLKKEELNV